MGNASSLLTPSESSAASRASTSPVCDPGSGSYWVSTSRKAGGRNDFPSMPSTQPPSTFMTRGARSFMVSGSRSWKMSSAREMWLWAEKISVPAGSPASASGPGCRSFGAPSPPLGYLTVFVAAAISTPLVRTAADYFDVVAIVNARC